ncbi:MAG: DUF523 domain-containing protein [Firmicutes bacterium]|nr:DUF523 domain-containing protein [Bacillota bacterium]
MDRVPTAKQAPILVSACLAGFPCRYDCKSKPNREVMILVAAGLALPVCPEQLGGLPTPRSAAEIVGGDGHDVLAGKARVINGTGADVSDEFVRGARAVAQLARLYGVKIALLQERSPSCGTSQVYDGTFSRRLRPGAGVAAARLAQLGIEVKTVNDK